MRKKCVEPCTSASIGEQPSERESKGFIRQRTGTAGRTGQGPGKEGVPMRGGCPGGIREIQP